MLSRLSRIRVSDFEITRPRHSANWRRSLRHSRTRRLPMSTSDCLHPDTDLQGNHIQSTTTKIQAGIKQQNDTRMHHQSHPDVPIPMVAYRKPHRNRPIIQRTRRRSPRHQRRRQETVLINLLRSRRKRSPMGQEPKSREMDTSS